jgi:ketosteroid isomerase-like protein
LVNPVDETGRTAQVQRDIAKLDRLLAGDFTLINPPAGRLLNKSQFLADLSSGDLRYESLNYDDIGLRAYRDVALVTGRVVRKGQYKGQDNSGQFRFIYVFVKHQGRWQIAIAQATRIAQ